MIRYMQIMWDLEGCLNVLLILLRPSYYYILQPHVIFTRKRFCRFENKITVKQLECGNLQMFFFFLIKYALQQLHKIPVKIHSKFYFCRIKFKIWIGCTSRRIQRSIQMSQIKFYIKGCINKTYMPYSIIFYHDNNHHDHGLFL